MVHPIRVFCRQNGLLEHEFAAEIGCDPTYLSSILNGRSKAGAGFARKAFQRFGIPLHDILLWVFSSGNVRHTSPRSKSKSYAVGVTADPKRAKRARRA